MNADEIWALLPAVHRIRDEEGTGALRALVGVIADQVAVLDESLEQFYDDQFIEVCADWVAPYIGDLVGYHTLHGVVPAVASPRAEVANTIRYRRRKGTAAMLEQMARDVTGWPARAVEFFERVAASLGYAQLRASTPDEIRRGADDEGAMGPMSRCPHRTDRRRVRYLASCRRRPSMCLVQPRAARRPHPVGLG